MSIVKALIIGLIAGITDFLPVSATGHVTLFGNILGMEGEIDLMFIVALHLGTMISVLLVYFGPIAKTFAESVHVAGDLITNMKVAFTGSGRREKKYRKIVTGPYRKIVVMLIFAMIPTIIFGILSMMLTAALCGNLLGSGIGMLVSALLLLVASFAGKLYKGPHEAKYFDAFLVGAFQGFSGFAGISRLAMTASSAFLSGFTTKLALLFSFLLYIPTVLGSFFFVAIRNKSFLSGVGAGYTIIAMFTAAIVGYFALLLFRRFISPRFTRYFAVYCFAIGVVSVIIYLV